MHCSFVFMKTVFNISLVRTWKSICTLHRHFAEFFWGKVKGKASNEDVAKYAYETNQIWEVFVLVDLPNVRLNLFV